MDIKPLAKTPLINNGDKATWNWFVELGNRINQLITKANTPVGAITWDSLTGKPDTFTPSTHKATHATGGSDALSSSDIGAATADHSHSGSVVQVVNYETGAVATGSTIIPIDDTIPQSTEGNQYMQLAFTPKSATNKLRIDVVWVGASSAATAAIVVALFKNDDVNAIAVTTTTIPSAGYRLTIPLTHFMTAGTTETITFKVRAGGHSSGTVTFNGQGGTRLYGGVMASSITVTEVAA